MIHMRAARSAQTSRTHMSAPIFDIDYRGRRLVTVNYSVLGFDIGGSTARPNLALQLACPVVAASINNQFVGCVWPNAPS